MKNISYIYIFNYLLLHCLRLVRLCSIVSHRVKKILSPTRKNSEKWCNMNCSSRIARHLLCLMKVTPLQILFEIFKFRANSKETCILDEIKSKKTYETSHYRNQCFRNEVGYANQWVKIPATIKTMNFFGKIQNFLFFICSMS